jgi:hypothetical protein
MAEEKKKPPISNTGSQYFEEMVGLLFVLILLSALVSRFQEIFSDGEISAYAIFGERLVNFFVDKIWPFVLIFGFVVSVLAIWFIFYSIWRSQTIDKYEKVAYAPLSPGTEALKIGKNGRWQKILQLANSPNPSDWRSAIIEADVMLEETLRSAGYEGESVGDMLKSITKSDIVSLDSAWEAHKFRNKIAHSGLEFELNERETKRIIALFERVFIEFDVI